MRKIYILIIIFSLYFINTASSQNILTWEACVAEAKKKHPDLISAAEKVKQVKADKMIEISSTLPQIDGTLSGKSTKASTGATSDSYSYSVTGTQLIFDGFKTLHDISSSSKTLEAEEYNYKVTSSDIRLNLRNSFVGLLKAQELSILTKDISERRRQNLKLVNLRYEAGREHKGSLLTAEADLANAEYEAKQAERNIILYQRELSKEMGLEKLNLVSVKGRFSLTRDYDIKPDIENLADTTPFLQELIAEKEATRYDLKSKQADFFPAVYLNGSAGKSSGEWPPDDDSWSFGMSVTLPIFEGGSRIVDIRKAKSKLRQAETDERSGRDSVLFTLEKTWKDLRDTIENLSVQEKFLQAAEERAKVTQAQYETGLISFDDWIIIEDNLVSAKKSYLNAQANMMIAEAYWIQAIGGTLEYDE
ncbi:MAG: TolC family protein [Candidatus Omnitrophica bacterium]|nr:TolC family protein [Candidatus Omnitrophota bacterium]